MLLAEKLNVLVDGDPLLLQDSASGTIGHSMAKVTT